MGVRVQFIFVGWLVMMQACAGTRNAAELQPAENRLQLPLEVIALEAMLEAVPDNQSLLVETAAALVKQGKAAFVAGAVLRPADSEDERANAAVLRGWFSRARSYGMHALSLSHADFEKQLEKEASRALALVTDVDVPALYWTAIAWGWQWLVNSDPRVELAELEVVHAMLRRVQELNGDFDADMLVQDLIRRLEELPSSAAVESPLPMEFAHGQENK